MVKRKTALKIRKTHRYLGLFIGIQFIIWSVSGLYFSWTDIDEIHGDDFRKHHVENPSFNNLISPAEANANLPINSLELKDIGGVPYYLVDGNKLINARTGEIKDELSSEEAVLIARKHMVDGLNITGVERIEETGNHHEYRSGALPAYVLSFNQPNNLKAYISIQDASFRSIRHRDWRWFDFLWMTHTMDYEGRDDFNNLVLRIFSLLGLITVLSGFVLWYISSPTVFKIKRKIKRN
ncbi:PepSY domain-containing protein [Gillisia sp. Q332]|uniref:PepSY domain-containing protein n=1 Tax=Gillisia xinjiangensis TaxID=3384765 RepID=UPI003918FFD1